MAETPRLFCFGLGFSATVLARRVLEQSWRVAGTHRSAEGVAAAEALGIEAYQFGPDHPLDNPTDALAGTTHLVSAIPPSETGDPVIDAHSDDICAIVSLRWIGYLSATSVYGDRGGAAVTEADSLLPVSTRARKRARAESLWLDLWQRDSLPVHLFRLAGIYGPGRSVLDQVRAGRAKRIAKPGQKFSRIHVDDIASALIASIDAPNPGAVYNLCDDEPAPSADVTAYACELLDVDPPPLVPFDEAVKEMSPMAREFWADSRQISNRRMHEELGLSLEYPTYRVGLTAIASETG